MKIITKSIAALSFLLIAGASFTAMASDKIEPALQDKVTKQMTDQGYEVRKMQMEDGMIEVYAVKDGKTFELYLDKDLKLVKTNDQEDGEAEGKEG